MFAVAQRDMGAGLRRGPAAGIGSRWPGICKSNFGGAGHSAQSFSPERQCSVAFVFEKDCTRGMSRKLAQRKEAVRKIRALNLSYGKAQDASFSIAFASCLTRCSCVRGF